MLRAAGLYIAIWASCIGLAQGGVVLDGSLGAGGPIPGPNYLISSAMGKIAGNNLFQSFKQFSLVSTESATFTGPPNIQNIVSRVTGGSASAIDGKIRSDIQGANFFLLNSSGVMFGPNAQLDVSGSVAVSTANYVKTADAGRFSARLGGTDLLSSAPITAFGFLNSKPATVSFTGSNVLNVDQITLGPAFNVAPATVFSVVAGDITTTGAYISGQGSRVSLIGVRSPGEATFNPVDINSVVDLAQFRTLANVELTNATQIDTSGPGGGGILLGGNSVLLDQFSQIVSQTLGSQAGGNVMIRARELTMNDSAISTTTLGSGKAGDVNISVNHVFATTGHSIIGAATGGSGRGGDITIRANDFRMTRAGIAGFPTGGAVSTSTLSSGSAGDISVTTRSMLLDSSFLASISTFLGTGNAGNIDVHTGILKMRKGSISTSTLRASGGNIRIKADDYVDLQTSFIQANAGNGSGGNVTIDPILIVLKDSVVSADAGVGRGGNVRLISDLFFTFDSSVTASGTIANGTVNITAPELDLGAELITLPGSLVDAQYRLQERCAALLQGDFSSFISLGRGGTEEDPEELELEF